MPSDPTDLARALAPEVAKIVAPEVAEEVVKRLRPVHRAIAATNEATNATVSKLAGAMEVREAEGAARKAEMVAAAQRLSGQMDALVRLHGLPVEEADGSPMHPRTAAALDKLGEESVDTLTRWVRGVRRLPGAVWAYLVADKVRTAALAVAASGFVVDVATGSPVSTALARAIARALTVAAGPVADAGGTP